MKALMLKDTGGIDSLGFVDLPDPKPGENAGAIIPH